MIRTTVILLALGTMMAPMAASAGAMPQDMAAVRLPNTFDRPQAVSNSPQAAASPEDPARTAAAEAALKTTIAAIQAGTPNYGDMSADLAAKVREQSSAITPLIQSFGSVQSLAHVGVENGADLFMVGFENQITQWIIAQNDEGKIIALLFRPASASAGN